MWIVSKLIIRSRSYSFASSGQPPHDDLALIADEQELVNMLRLVEWGEDPVQVAVCDACGTVGCASGNYVAVRRLDDFVVMAPATRAYAPTADEFEKAQYVEPWFIRKRGVPLVPTAHWEHLRDEGAPLPAAERLEPLRWSEAVLAAQIEAPRRLLGEPGQPPRRRLTEIVVATEPFIDPTTLDLLGDVRRWAKEGATAVLRRPEPGDRISLFLSDDLNEVVLFGRYGDDYGLYFEPGLLLVPSRTA
jgi:hypothetical protein